MAGYIPTSKTDVHATPQDLFDKLDAEFHFTLDPCAEPGNAKCKKFFTEEQDGLKQSWANENVFMNPPYSKTKDWMKKAYDSARNDNATVVCLIKSITDTQAWHRYAKYGEVRFIEGRLKFGNSPQCAPFSSALVIFRRPEITITPNGLVAQKLDRLHMTPVV